MILFKITYVLHDPAKPEDHKRRLFHTIQVNELKFPQSDFLTATYQAIKEITLLNNPSFHPAKDETHQIAFYILEIKEIRPKR
jgi:hypothetical protein